MDLSAYRVAVFDFDGTLIESNALKHQCFIESCRNLNEVEEMQKILRNKELTRSDIFEAFCLAVGEDRKEAVRMLSTFNHRLRDRMMACKMVAGAEKLLLKMVNAGVTLHISSLTPTKELVLLLKRRNLHHFFSKAYGSPQKKDKTLRVIIETANVDPSTVVVIGDGEDDYLSALKNNTAFIPVGEGRGSHQLSVMKISDLAASF